MEPLTFKELADLIRSHILDLGADTLALKRAYTPGPSGDISEAYANIMLAYRHLEDARMRIGKALQASEDGVSIYDKPKP